MNNLLKMTEADYNTLISADGEPRSPYVINIYDAGKVKYSHEPSTEYFTIIPLSTSGTFEISIENMHDSFSDLTTTNYLFYSLNGGDSWQRITEASNNIISITFSTSQYVDKKIIFKSNLWANRAKILINCSQNYYVSGNILSLSQGDLFTEYPTDIYNESFNGLFMDDTHLISAKNLYLPENYNTYSNTNVYSTIFQGCTNLRSTPIIKIPAFSSYNIFWCGLSGCTNLTNVYISITGELLQYAAENNITSTMDTDYKMFCKLLYHKSNININLITDITLDINDTTYRNIYRYGLRELIGYFYEIKSDFITADHQLATNWTINNIPLKDILDLNDINEEYNA